jgi:hypothetical protein
MRSAKIIRIPFLIPRDIPRLKAHILCDLKVGISGTRRRPVMIRSIVELLIVMLF